MLGVGRYLAVGIAAIVSYDGNRAMRRPAILDSAALGALAALFATRSSPRHLRSPIAAPDLVSWKARRWISADRAERDVAPTPTRRNTAGETQR